MPFDRAAYPDNWEDIREQILDRDKHQCQFCGVENYAIGARNLTGDFVPADTIDDHLSDDDWFVEQFDTLDYPRTFKIVLTIAHLGTDYPDGTPGDKTDKMDCRPENLAALCQKCHLTYDIDEHMANAAATRERKIRESGQLDFFDEVRS